MAGSPIICALQSGSPCLVDWKMIETKTMTEIITEGDLVLVYIILISWCWISNPFGCALFSSFVNPLHGDRLSKMMKSQSNLPKKITYKIFAFIWLSNQWNGIQMNWILWTFELHFWIKYGWFSLIFHSVFRFFGIQNRTCFPNLSTWECFCFKIITLIFSVYFSSSPFLIV